MTVRLTENLTGYGTKSLTGQVNFTTVYASLITCYQSGV